MSDVASLGIKIDTSQTVAATTALDKFAASGKAAQSAATGLEKASAGAAKGASGIDQAARAAANGGALARHELINLSRQIQDVGVSLASGQSLFTVLVQQGTQIADIFGSSSNGSVGGAIKQIGSGIASVLTPTRLLAGGIVAAGAAAYVAYGQWKSFALQLDDTARAAGTTTGELSKLQAAASVKGIAGDDFNKGIVSFGRSVYDMRNNMGGLADVFRANNVHARDFDEAMSKAADLIQRAGSDQQRLVLLQQMGLPATMEWVRLLSGGADGLRKAKEAMAEFAADPAMIQKAREFDEAWNRAWTNFGLNARSAFQTALQAGSGLFDKMAELARSAGNSSFWNRFITSEGMKAAGVESVTAFDQRFGSPGDTGNSALRSDLDKRAASLRGGTTVDPNAIQRAISLEQQRLGILGQTATVQQQVRAVELQIQAARLNGVNITKAEEDALKRLAAEQALGTSQIKAAADAQRIEADTIGMSIGQATAYAAAQNAINEARRAGRPLTADNIAAIQREATALGEAAQRADDMRWKYESLVRGPLQTFRQELSNGATFFDALKKAGVSALDAISTKLMDMAAQGLWKAALGGFSGGTGGGILSLFGIGGGTTTGLDGLAAIHHTGYGPGDPIKGRYVHPAYFDDAPRFHSGIGPGERAAIIRNDESVLTPGQMRALAPANQQPAVTIVNYNTFNNADPGSEARMRAYVDQSSQRTLQQAVQVTNKTAANNMAYRGAFQ